MKQSLSAHYIDIKGIKINSIPKKGPLIIAASHPNSFLDAIIVATLINRPLHFLARSDVFKAKWANAILRKINLIPIYRLQEGHENLNRNNQTFKECCNLLNMGGAILIFAEGVSVSDMKLRPLKKGLARIAFGFSEQKTSEHKCQIIPLALNYDRPKEFRSKISVAVGKLIKPTDYMAIYQQNHNKGFLALNKAIFEELKGYTIEVSNSNYMMYKAMAELDSCFEENSLARKIRIAQQINQSKAVKSNLSKELTSEIHKCFDLLKQYKLNFRKLKINNGISTLNVLFIITCAPIAFICLALNFIPLALAKYLSDKKVKLDEFYASVRFALGTLLWLIYSIASAILLSLYIHKVFILTPLLLLLALKFYLLYYEKLKYTNATIRLGRLKKNFSDYATLQKSIKKIYRLRKELALSLDNTNLV